MISFRFVSFRFSVYIFCFVSFLSLQILFRFFVFRFVSFRCVSFLTLQGPEFESCLDDKYPSFPHHLKVTAMTDIAKILVKMVLNTSWMTINILNYWIYTLQLCCIDWLVFNAERYQYFSYIIKVLQLGYGLDHFWCFIIKAHFVVYSPTIR